MKLILGIILFFIGLPIHAQGTVSVFTNRIFLITSFPNSDLSNKYTVSSYHEHITFDKPINFGPLTKISLYGTQYGTSFFVDSSLPMNILSPSPSWVESITQFRLGLTQQILQDFPLTGDLVVALVLGNKNYLSDEFMDYIRFSGLAHLFALSGLHLVVCIGVVIWILSLLGVPKPYLGLATFPFSLLYLLIGGAGISLQRAVLFHFLGALFSIIRIPISTAKILLFSFMIHIVFLPYNIFSLSFVLSYVSIMGIVIFYKFCYDMLCLFLFKNLSSLLAVSLGAFMMTAPVIVYFFGYINMYSALSSTIIIPFMPMVLILCFIAVLSSMFAISFPFLDIALSAVKYSIMTFSRMFSHVPYGIIFFENEVVVSLIMGLIIGILLLVTIRKKNEKTMG